MDDARRRLAASPYHVASGDVLLLCSAHKGGALNRGAQWIGRRREVRYTHVALVVNNTHIADAMPDLGVKFRLWRDIESDYDLDACSVARHIALAADPAGFGRVYRSALFYLHQPYRIRSALADAGRIRDRAGLVCSHFVAAVLERAGIVASTRRPSATLPVDIDFCTRDSADWYRFPLRGYGLLRDTPAPSDDDPYWQALTESLGLGGTPAVSRRTSRSSVAAPRHSMLDRADTLLREGTTLRETVADTLQNTVETQYDLSRAIAELDRLMLGLSNAVAQGSPQALEIAAAWLGSRGVADAHGIATSPVLLARLESLYRRQPTQPIFLHEEEDGEQRRAAHRRALRDQTRLLREVAAQHMRVFNQCAEMIAWLAHRLPDIADPRRAIDCSLAIIDSLLDSAAFLRAEPVEAKTLRIGQMDARVDEFVDWAIAADLDAEALETAKDTFNEIALYDVDAELWQLHAEPLLLDWRDRLQTHLTGLPPLAAPSAPSAS